jgi:vancomycin resistance protein YoaR
LLEARTTNARTRRSARPRWQRLLLQRGLPAVTLLGAVGLLVGLIFAGSAAKLAPGVQIAGVDVGGLTPRQARALLARRATALANTPVVFRAANRSWKIRPSQLGVTIDVRAAVAAAQKQGEGFGPFRGFRRLDVRFFGADVQPSVRVWRTALDLELARLASEVNRPHRDAAIRLHGLRPAIVPAQTGAVLDRKAAASVLVRALASFDRAPVALPVRTDSPRVTAPQLVRAAAQIRTALSGPVRLRLGPTRWRLSRFRLASLLEPPHDGMRRPRIAGSAADAYFVKLAHTVGTAPVDARFAVDGPKVWVVPGKPGLALDVAATARNLLAAALSPTARVGDVVVGEQQPERSTADLKAMGVTGIVSSYETFFGGVPNRIHNVQVVSHLVDEQLIPPGKEWSFNGATGARTADKGFLEAPVIINGELQTGLGGGVCQVSTTVFNAAYEAGLKITARTNHALYISHYPQGRDATVDYPSVDLKFVNDTGHWLLLRTFVSSSSLTVSLYGAPQHRKVESRTGALYTVGAAPLKKVPDPTLPKGKTVVENGGAPARATTVERKVYLPNGKLLHDDIFHSSYRAEPGLVRVGTKKKPPKLDKGKSRPPTSTTPELPPLQ